MIPRLAYAHWPGSIYDGFLDVDVGYEGLERKMARA